VKDHRQLGFERVRMSFLRSVHSLDAACLQCRWQLQLQVQPICLKIPSMPFLPRFLVYLWTLSSRSSGPPKFNKGDPLRWVPEVTHIYRSWREAALLASFLWTDINVQASTSWAVEFAHRSGHAPLRILLNPYVVRSRDRPKVYECTKTFSIATIMSPHSSSQTTSCMHQI
jgi:hypothetical protein